MKLRNLIMALLLCMVIGVFATGCEGDTGPAGPQGEQGEKGDKGDKGDPGEDAEPADAREFSYPFLVNWGKPSGMTSCEDDLLKTEGVFPGPASLTPLPATQDAARKAAAAGNEATANGYVLVQCTDSVFDRPANPDIDGDGTAGDLAAFEVVADNNPLLFVKTGRAKEMSSEGSKPAAVSEAAVSVITNKMFSGGLLFADMDTRGGSDEALQRAQLYHDCAVGTAPSEIRGEWRAVEIVKTSVNQRLSDTGEDKGLMQNIPNTDLVETTRKVCLRLDSLPGTVKCYVREEVNAPGTEGSYTGLGLATGKEDSQKETIGIYKDGALTAVKPAAAASGDNEGKVAPDDSPANAQFIGDVNDFQREKLCNLFVEAAPTTP